MGNSPSNKLSAVKFVSGRELGAKQTSKGT